MPNADGTTTDGTAAACVFSPSPDGKWLVCKKCKAKVRNHGVPTYQLCKPRNSIHATSDPAELAQQLSRDIEAILANGEAGVTAVEIERRLAACRAESCRERFTGYGCRLCGCTIGVRAWLNGLTARVNGEKRWFCTERRWMPEGMG